MAKPTRMQWVKRLLAQIEAQTRYAAPFEKRYNNEYILPFLAKEYSEVYPGLVIASADGRVVDSVVTGSLHSMLDVPKTGTAGLVAEALTERLTLSGITSDDAEAAKLLEAAWEDNDLDVMHHEAHREALVSARSFASVAREAGGDRAVVGIESCTQAAAHRMQSPPYDVDAYLKIWRDEWTGDRVGLLRLPGFDFNLVEAAAEVKDPEGSGEFSRWVVDGEPIETKLAGVPVVEFAPRSRLLKEPTSEIDRITTSVDVIDLIEGLMVFAGHFGAVPIRYATGLDIPRDPKDPSKPLLGKDGKPMIGLNPRADHFWSNSNEKAEFGQLEPAGLASFVTWADHAASVLRRQTKLPSAYFSLDLKSHMSAELLKVDEAPMVRRVRAMGEGGNLNASWRRVGKWKLAIEAPSKRVKIKPRWVDPETRIESADTDRFQKLVASGMGIRTAAEKVLGWDRETIDAAVDEAQDRADVGDSFSLLDAGTRATLKALPSALEPAAAGA